MKICEWCGHSVKKHEEFQDYTRCTVGGCMCRGDLGMRLLKELDKQFEDGKKEVDANGT